MEADPRQLLEGLWRWTARHPEWHPDGRFGSQVASYAFHVDGELTLVDPILPEEPGRLWELLDGLAARRLNIAITIPYHVRDAERVWRRFRDAGTEARIAGHPAAARRLTDDSGFVALEPGAALGGVVALAIGRPRRFELPLHVASHRAIAFGDAVVTTPEGDLRMWHPEPIDEARARWYRERFAPTLEPLVRLDPAHVLVTHGEPVLGGGAEALRRAAARPPWHHRA